ncbi:hypothetical protein NW762_014152 [Fusarium torreyae]|uniref:Uncharacterized protein n=1 Tax=Fusarium torreyae TaxID=1237075 RepID=A0A9W8RNE9_9HYPO|nr:hypothetical protein NW762_014152 [Fusarium torreyae]
MIEGDQAVELAQFPDWKLTKDPNCFLCPTAYEPEEHGAVEHAIFSISAEKLILLKKHISNGASEIELSTAEALCAFLWRHVVCARNIDPREYCEAKLSITVDARNRVESPSIPSNFWGNFSEPNAVARAPLINLQHPHASGERQSVIYLDLAYRIKRAIASVNNTAVRRLIGLLNQMPKSTTLTWNVDRYPGPDMLIVCLQAHKYNDIYFGHRLGNPSAMRVTVGDTEGQPDGRCIILPPRRGVHGLEVILQYDVSTLERLENDIQFSYFFVRRN